MVLHLAHLMYLQVNSLQSMTLFMNHTFVASGSV